MIINPQLFEAYLKCATKCYLKSLDEAGTGNAYAEWLQAQNETYRSDGIQRLTLEAEPDSYVTNPSELKNIKTATWRLAIGFVARAQSLESMLHAVERIPSEGRGKPAQYIPVRYVFNNKASKSDKLLLAFDALVFSKAIGSKVTFGKVVHGDKQAVHRVKVNFLERTVKKVLDKIGKLLSAGSPPDLMLNKHCAECEFQQQCRSKAIEKDELSLLAKMTDKERKKFHDKGIFTITQLSYTFRPRRRSRRMKDKHEKYHHALKALAIREKKIHVVGNPQLNIDTPIYFDVEGLPDRDFYYLIGVRVERNQGVSQQNLWADTAADEKYIWSAFLDIVLEFDSPVLMHYGSFEMTFLKRMCARYGRPPEGSPVAKAIDSSVNVLSIIFAQVYFPLYSNGLKEIAKHLGFKWTDPSSSGLQSTVWRYEWESSCSPALREKLVTYNSDDCEALSLVCRTLRRLLVPETDVDKTSTILPEVVYADALNKSMLSKWRVFKSPLVDLEHINEAAHWSYQRDRVFVRSGVPKINRGRLLRTNRCHNKVEKVVLGKVPTACPECGKQGRRKSRYLSRTVQDLVFGRDSVKRRVVRYDFQSYRCRSCNHEYGLNEWYLYARKWGWNVVAYFVYHIVALRIPQLTMQHSLKRVFGFDLARSSLNNLKSKVADEYLVTKRKILERIIHGELLHVDETRANIKGHLAYVWVLTNLKEVVYILTENREGEIVQQLLKEYKGVLVTDFYAAYESIACPQQKCLIHLIRDLNDEILNNPFDEEMKSISLRFAGLLKPMVATIDRFGLKKRFLQKHVVEVERFYVFLNASDFKSDAASKCKQRFEKNRDRLFTFLYYDGVPWNNNNAEHAIKAFARLRDVLGGSSSKKGVDEYLTLLSVAETCEYQGLDFLDFMRSREKDIETFARNHRG